MTDGGGAGGDRSGDRSPGPRRPFFEIYKLGQGVHLRGWTAVVAGLLVLGGAYSINDRLEGILPAEPWAVVVRVATALIWLCGLGLLAYWLIGVNRRCADFLIATEGEMKKVSWTTKRELIGSTKVVIFATMVLAAILFIVDVFFIELFHRIGVLEYSILAPLFGGSS